MNSGDKHGKKRRLPLKIDRRKPYMIVPDPQLDESERLIQLYRIGILDTPPEQEFDDIARMLALVFDTPFAAITLIDHSRQWFKALEGKLDVCETRRDESICTYTIASDDILVIPDTLTDPRAANIPLVAGETRIRFYAGVPLRLSSGARVGALCALGQKPAEITAYQREMLTLLGRQTVKLIEQRHRQQINAWLAQLFARCDLMVSLLDLDSGINVFTNAAWDQHYTGGDADALEMLRHLLPDVDNADLLDLVQNGSDQPRRWSNTRVVFPQGDASIANVQLIPDSAEAPPGSRRKLLVVIDDQADIHRARQEASEASFRANLLEKVASITQNPVIITDAAGQIEWVNPSFESITGYALGEVLGRRPGSFLQGEETDPEAVVRIGEHLRGGRGLRQEILNYAKNGRKYWQELDIQPAHDQNGKLTHFIAVQTDITLRKTQEQAMRNAHAEAERISQMKTRFLANVSHEIRTPLNGILGIAQYLGRSVPEAFRQDINILHRSGEHLLNLLNEMIDLSALEAGILDIHLEPFSPDEVLQDVFTLFETSAATKGLELRLNVDEPLAGRWFNGDAKRLRQVLMNLVGNAIKFTREGNVQLSCVSAPADDQLVSLKFSISDTGPGIRQEDKQRIFRRFSHLDAPEAGAGLGLSISRQILRRMNSRLMLESTVGEGSCFAFEIAMAPAEPLANAREHSTRLIEEADFTDAGPILVIDDNETNLRVMQSLLASLGATDVRLANSAQQALERQDSQDIAIAFVDIRMPGMDGFEFLERFRDLTRNSPTQPAMIACTALDGGAERQAIMARGFDGYIAKPVTLAELVELLQRRREELSLHAAPFLSRPSESVINASLQEKMDGNMSLIRHFLELLVEHNDSLWESVRQSMAEDDIQSLQRSIHTLKGQLAYFGTDHPVYRKVLHIDEMLKEQLPVPSEDVFELNRATDELVENARRELAETDARPPVSAAEG